MKVNRASLPLRTELFATRHREFTEGITVSYTDTVPDPRLDAAAIDYLDSIKRYFGISFHYLVLADARIEIGRDPLTISSRGRSHERDVTIQIGVVGGRDAGGNRLSTITTAQREAVEELMQGLSDTLQVPLEVDDHIESRTLRDAALVHEEAEENLEFALDEHEAAQAHTQGV